MRGFTVLILLNRQHKVDENKNDAAALCFHKRMLKISWIDTRTKCELLKKTTHKDKPSTHNL